MPDGYLHKLPPMTLNAHQLRNALDFVNPDGAKDTDQLESNLCIGYRPEAVIDGESYPAGYYAHFEEYPEEGSIFLDADKSNIASPQALTPITADDVTDEIWADVPVNLDSTKQDVADIYNAVIKGLAK